MVISSNQIKYLIVSLCAIGAAYRNKFECMVQKDKNDDDNVGRKQTAYFELKKDCYTFTLLSHRMSTMQLEAGTHASSNRNCKFVQGLAARFVSDLCLRDQQLGLTTANCTKFTFSLI